MSTIAAYFAKYRIHGLRRLAKATHCKPGYLQQLVVNPKKRPSMSLAQRLVHASNGELSFEGLANPVRIWVRGPNKNDETLETPDEA